MPLTRIKSTAIETGGITTAKIADDAVTSTKIDDSQITLGFRNKIIGGNFSTNPWQRGTSFTSHTSGYTADRFSLFDNTAGVIDGLKTSDAPTVAEAGVFTQHCFHVDVTTADSSIGSSDECNVWQAVEGYNVSDLGFGQSGTRYFTLSFWHKHTKTGTNCVAFRNVDASRRTYVAEYTQSVSDTWEKAELTIPVDTSGTWDYTNGVGLYVFFSIAVGSGKQTTADSWQSGDYRATSNQVNNLDSTSNNFKIALVQLEAGQTATAFENRSVGQELELCKRYAEKIELGGLLGAYFSTYNNFFSENIYYNVEKRATPTMSILSGTAFWATPGRGLVSATTNSSLSPSGNTTTKFSIYQTRTAGSLTPTENYTYVLEPSVVVLMDSEL